jgi:hypothetical protein
MGRRVTILGPVRHDLCTVVDAAYLPRALALQRSLLAHAADSTLHVVAMDDPTEELLHRLDLARVVVHPLSRLEEQDPSLRAVRSTRSAAEYCWTAKASAVLHVFETSPELSVLTYADSDMELFADPQVLLDEMGDGSVAIVPHRFAALHAAAESTSGPYNAGWVTFRNDYRARRVLEWWRDRCLEWCYHRLEDGKMSDQRYLDDWPQRFDGVHVLGHPGAGLAPWNVARYELGEEDGRITVDGEPLVFYHYHSLRLYERTPVARVSSALRGTPRGGARFLWWTNYPVSERELRLVWLPYLNRLEEARALIRAADPQLSDGVGRWRLRDEMPLRLAPVVAVRRAERALRHPRLLPLRDVCTNRRAGAGAARRASGADES